MDDVWIATAEIDLVEKRRYQGVGGAVGEGYDHNGLGEGIDDGEGFTVPVVSDALALEVHVVAGTGAREGAVGVHAVSESAFGLLVLAVFAVL